MNILENLELGIVSHSPEETQHLAAALALVLPVDHVLTLRGDLGAGKTTFVKGLAEAWGIREVVTSPTYNLYSIYEGERQLVHMDAYRLNGAESMEELMLEEFLKTPYCLAIEWPEKIEEWIPADAWHLTFNITETGHYLRLKNR
ncbi:MAG: tRNA (adenosine(37)-N6)-threonylcarbamoyltransferase complex ATPase subunit type 1 TsaE [Opitutales bacterium]|nr:tRNA (adenosine(37)-N6)-threonylcarbamoyltransferase complex ATPase subunit type 1 TsaE [Opitutales bacterium]